MALKLEINDRKRTEKKNKDVLHKHKYATEQPMDQKGNQTRNQKLP